MNIKIVTEKVVFSIGDTTKVAEIEKFLQEENVIHVCVDDKKYLLSRRDIKRIEAEKPPKSVGGKMLCLVMDQIRVKEEIIEDMLNVFNEEKPLNSFSFESYISEEEISRILQNFADKYMAKMEFSHLP